METDTEIIRSLNDRFRKSLPFPSSIPGRVMLTEGIRRLTEDNPATGQPLAKLFRAIREFDDFGEHNDPWHQHDFGALEFDHQKIFWKIDYYAPDLLHGSENPADPVQTVRVLTILLASEY